jgi:hypothetical protein
MDYYIDSFQDYLETLCINHKRVAHDPAPGGTKSFIRFHAPDDLNQVPNNPGTTLVIVTRYYGKAIGTMDESAMRQWVQIRFCTYAATPTDGDFTGSISTAQDTAFTVMLDFITRMLHDFRIDDCGPLKGIELDQCNWDELPEQPFLENHFGWDLTIPFRSYFPPYNPGAWNL